METTIVSLLTTHAFELRLLITVLSLAGAFALITLGKALVAALKAAHRTLAGGSPILATGASR